jgi:hypothetical protein
MRNRGLKAASNITMCTKETFPTILVEGGFLNNRRDIEYINSDKGVKAYAKAISSALIQTFNLTKDFPGTALEQKTSSSEYVVSTSYENTTRYICKDKVLASAITICDKNGGTKVFDDEGNVLHTSKLEAPTVSYPRVKIGSKGDKKMSYGQTLKMRDEPSAKSGSIITEIAYGETLALVSKANDAFWLCETLDGKFRGYMHSAYLNEINS